jgi:dTDP-4-amino-4,6-dideoxygalactose transaminase
MTKLAIHGGPPVRSRPFPAHVTIGPEEKAAVASVLDSGMLSKYLGCRHPNFYGGPQVQALEREWAEYFGVRHAIAVNSATSGLQCAVGATGIEPGEEVIVSPYTMCASVTAPLIYNAVPVFADIEEDCFCLDPESIEKKITPRTKAILVVDIFGQAYDAEAVNALAERHGLYVIEDAAQAPGAAYKGRFAGTLGHLGVYSLNYHKHIHCGEGGVVVTDDDALAEKVRLIRNHAEAVVEGADPASLVNMIGFNFRLTEMEAAVARCQLRKLAGLLEKRRENVLYLEKRLAGLEALTFPKIRKDCTHSYYVHACKFDEKKAGVSRDVYIAAVRAELPPFALRESEGVKLNSGYVKPLYLLPLFQRLIAYGSQGCPFTSPWYQGKADYRQGLCPVVERLQAQELFLHEFMLPSMNPPDLEDVGRAFEKVYENRRFLGHRD